MEANKEQVNKGNKAENLRKCRERRRQLMLEESEDERERRLAKRREAWRDRSAETKGKRIVYLREYNSSKMQKYNEQTHWRKENRKRKKLKPSQTA